jgi:sterol desaturase/sphingolipid hydroxylase (fatty acid hydroxylase superfamily)
MPFLYLDLLRLLPEVLQLILFFLAIDLCRYWKHRWLHSRPFLRAVHSIHHSADNLNFFTAYRIHILEYLFDALITFVPLVLLGNPPEIGLAVYVLLVSYNGFLHSGINVSFGPLDYILVSPRFHATHHSVERAEYDANFGSIFSFWDLAFGTARFQRSLPKCYGLPVANVPPTFARQLFSPLIGTLRRVRRMRRVSGT